MPQVHALIAGLYTTLMQLMTQLARKEKKRKEKTTPFGVNLMRSQVLYRAAQRLRGFFLF